MTSQLSRTYFKRTIGSISNYLISVDYGLYMYLCLTTKWIFGLSTAHFGNKLNWIENCLFFPSFNAHCFYPCFNVQARKWLCIISPLLSPLSFSSLYFFIHICLSLLLILCLKLSLSLFLSHSLSPFFLYFLFLSVLFSSLYVWFLF